MRTIPEPPDPAVDLVDGEYPAPPPPEPVFATAFCPSVFGGD